MPKRSEPILVKRTFKFDLTKSTRQHPFMNRPSLWIMCQLGQSEQNSFINFAIQLDE